MNEGRIDVNIAGHTHRFRIVEPQEGQNYPVIISGAPREGSATIIRVEATDKLLKIIVTNDQGEIVGAYEIK